MGRRERTFSSTQDCSLAEERERVDKIVEVGSPPLLPLSCLLFYHCSLAFAVCCFQEGEGRDRQRSLVPRSSPFPRVTCSFLDRLPNALLPPASSTAR